MAPGEMQAGGLRNFDDSWLISPSAARELLMQRNGTETRRTGLLVMAGQGRLFEMPELNQRFLAVEGFFYPGSIGVKLACKWEKIGEDFFSEDRLEGRILLGSTPAWGMAVKTLRQTLGDLSEKPIWDIMFLWEAAFSLGHIKGRLQLDWPFGAGDNSEADHRRRNLLKLTMTTVNIAAAVVVDREGDGTPNLGFHVMLALDSGVGLEFRADPATGSIGPGLTLLRGGMMIRTSHVVHPHLGVTHRIMLAVGRCGGTP